MFQIFHRTTLPSRFIKKRYFSEITLKKNLRKNSLAAEKHVFEGVRLQNHLDKNYFHWISDDINFSIIAQYSDGGTKIVKTSFLPD